MRGFELLLNDGSEETQVANQPVLTTVELETENEEPIVELTIPPQYVRYIRLKSQTTVGFEVAEFRVFGSGFVPAPTTFPTFSILVRNWHCGGASAGRSSTSVQNACRAC